MKALILPLALLLIAIALTVENDQLRAENELLRHERDHATLAAKQLWDTINRAASEP